MTSSYLYLNGLRVHYLRWDPDGAGRPVLLLHGLASNARIWEKAALHLAERGLLPLAPDLRGHGLTDKPDGDYDFDAFHRDLLAFVSANELEKPVLAGHAWGALLAVDYASRLPFGPLAPSGIVLVDGGVTQLDEGPDVTWEAARDRLAPPRLDGTPLEAFLRRLSGSSADWQPDDQAVQATLASYEISEDETISPRLTYERHIQILRATWAYKTYERFGRVRCPALLVATRPKEPRSAEEGQRLAQIEQGLVQARQRIADLSLHWMQESDHDLPLQRPEELAGLMADFIAKVERGSLG